MGTKFVNLIILCQDEDFFDRIVIGNEILVGRPLVFFHEKRVYGMGL